MAEINYNVDVNDAKEGFDVIPAGTYVAIIEKSEYENTKNGTGKKLALTYHILDGRYKGTKLFNNLNLENENEQAVNISRRTLNSIGVATGVTGTIKDSSMLHNIPMHVEVIVKDDKQYGKKNEIKKHLPLNSESVQDNNAQAQVPPAQQPPVNQGSDNFNAPPKKGRPWEK